MQVRAKERRPMLAQKHHEAPDGQRGKQKIGAEVLGTIHVRHEIVPWFDERSNAPLKSGMRDNFYDHICGTLVGLLLACLGFWFRISLGGYGAKRFRR